MVADVGATRCRGVYGTYLGFPLTLRVAPLPEIAPESEGAGEAGPGPGDERGCASWAAAACCRRAPDLRPIEVAGKSFSRLRVMVACSVVLEM